MKNERGQTLEQFLAAYSPKDYDRPSVTVDVVILTDTGEILLIQRRDHPHLGQWALPGGFLNMDETLYDAAARELREETGLSGVALRAIGMFAAPTRDPRTRVLTAAFAATVAKNAMKVRPGDDAADAQWFRWTCQPTGCIEKIPAATQQDPLDIALPCTAYGEPLAKQGEGYLLTLKNQRASLSAALAVDANGVAVLLRSPAEGQEDAGIAGDHALIVFSALRSMKTL